MAGRSVRPLNDLEWADCNEAHQFLQRMPSRLLYLVVPFFFLVGPAVLFLLSLAASRELSTRVLVTGLIFCLIYTSMYLSWLYYRFLLAVWQLWRHGLIQRAPVDKHLSLIR